MQCWRCSQQSFGLVFTYLFTYNYFIFVELSNHFSPAKLTAGIHKPNKQTVLPQSQVPTLFAKMKIGKVRGLGGKLGDVVCESFRIETMSDLQKVSLLDLRQHFDEKTTNWLFNISRGIEHEDVKERDLAKSIGCGKNFRGPEILDTRAKVESWMSNLCEELSERLMIDQDENDRVAKTLSVSLSLEKGSESRQGALYSYDGGYSHLSRSGPLYSYNQASLTKQALALIAKINQLPASDPNWRPKIRNITLAAFKFIEATQNNQSIQSFFKTKIVEKNEIKEEISVSDQSDDKVLPESKSSSCISDIESLVTQPNEDQDETIECEKCGKAVSPFELPEHLDWHMAKALAKELQSELQREQVEIDRTNAPNVIPQTSTQSQRGKRKNCEKPSAKVEAKKQKTIASFFSKR